MSKIQQAFNMIEALLQGTYEPLQFSCDMEQFLFENASIMQQENSEVNDVLQDEIPDLCSEGEPGFDPAHMLQGIKREYEKAKSLFNNQN